jgi:hypothetical protein
MRFLELFERLPSGGMTGQAADAFRPATMPDIYVAPTLEPLASHDDAGVTLVSARGATGKSLFAQRVSAMKSAPLWRLDLDRAVSADAFNAKLTNFYGPSGPDAFHTDPDALVLIDALDEARMRVSGVSWNEFLDSLLPFATGRRLLLLGRERVVEDVWMHFDDAGVPCDWVEISHFDPQQRVEYVNRRVEGKGASTDGEVYTSTRDAVLKALAGTVEAELSDAFVGYAPVLDAVVALLADENLAVVRNNFAATGRAADRIRVLIDILDSLLDREQRKTAPSVTELNLDPNEAYKPKEQLQWLAAELMGGAQPELDWCPPDERATYVRRIREFLRDHPFRSEERWASPVFSAYVTATQFDDVRIRPNLQAVGQRTGLLFDFVSAQNGAEMIDEWQFAALHASILSAEWHSVEAAVTIEEPSNEELSSMEGELVLLDESDKTRRTTFTLALDAPNQLRIFGPTAFLSVGFPAVVTLSAPNGALMLGPECFISCKELRIESETIEVARRTRGQDVKSTDDPVVALEASSNLSLGGSLVGRPTTEDFELRVPDDITLIYPWVSYRAPFELPAEAPDERAERFLNMLMTLLRRHGHSGRMAVFDKKLHGRQSIKHEDFTAVVDALEGLDIIRHEGALIYLQPDWERHWFSGKGRPGLPSLEDKRDDWSGALRAITARLQGK